MYLFLFTIVYCVITRILDMDFGFAMGIYVIGFGSLKGLLNHDQESKVIYNFKRTRSLYKKIGFKDSLMELLSLALVLFNGYILSPDTLSPFELIVTLFILAMLYRFLIWGITQSIREGNVDFKR